MNLIRYPKSFGVPWQMIEQQKYFHEHKRHSHKRLKLIILLLILFICLFCKGQQVNKPRDLFPNTINLTVQPQDLGIGVMFLHNFPEIGVYIAFAHGEYKIFDGGYIGDHWKGSFGLSRTFATKRLNRTTNYVMAGVNYHAWDRKLFEVYKLDESNYHPISIEAGYGATIGNFNVGTRLDILKWELGIDVGICF